VDVDGPTRRERADRLKERIYLTFAALAVVLALSTHEVETGEALRTLIVTVLGTLLAVFTADVIAHIVVHERVMTLPELRHALSASFGAIGAVTLPVVFLAIAAAGGWSTEAALRASAVALLLSLVIIGWIAVRRIAIQWWQRVIVMGAEAVLGLAVIGLQVLAHG